MKAVNIKWDTDGDYDIIKLLPTEIEIPEKLAVEDEDEISDYISNQTGFCHFGYQIQE